MQHSKTQFLGCHRTSEMVQNNYHVIMYGDPVIINFNNYAGRPGMYVVK